MIRLDLSDDAVGLLAGVGIVIAVGIMVTTMVTSCGDPEPQRDRNGCRPVEAYECPAVVP